MPATITGVIKALLAGPLPTVAVYRDKEDFDGAATGPYIVVHEAIATNPSQADSRDVRLTRELIQVDVWQPRTPTVPDDPSIRQTVWRALNSAPRFVLAGGDVLYRLRPESGHRAFFPATGLVQESISVAVARCAT